MKPQSQIYVAMESLLDEKAAERQWDERERIGLKIHVFSMLIINAITINK